MRQTFFAMLFAIAAATGTAALAAGQESTVETPQHGLGLLLDTPNAPVGEIYIDQSKMT